MRSQTNLVRRGSTYYFRKKIPADLQLHYGIPSNEIRTSLRTTDKLAAAKLALQKAAELEQQFEAVRQSLKRGAAVPITSEVSKALARVVMSRSLHADEDVRIRGMDEATFEVHAATLEADIKNARAGYARGDSSSIALQLEDWLRHLNVTADMDSPEGKKVAREFLTAQLQAFEGMQKRNFGEVIETPPQGPAILPSGSTAAKESSGAVTFQSLIDLWASERKPAIKTIQMVTAMGREFVETVGHSNVAKMTKADIVRFKDALILKHSDALGSGWKKMNLLSAVLNLAHENERIKDNPAKGVRIFIPKNAPKARVDFSKDDLKAIFSSPIYSAGLRPIAGGGEAAYWLPLIALYSGMRMEEIGQLLVSDIRQSQDIWYIDLNQEDGKRLKNPGATRTVPVHPVLLDLGLITYAQSHKNPKGRLFPGLKVDAAGVITGNFSKWFGRYLRTTIGITDSRKVFHSFRHTFKTACRDAHIPKEMHDALTGHREGDTSETYGEVSLQAKHGAIQRVSFEGLKHVQKKVSSNV